MVNYAADADECWARKKYLSPAEIAQRKKDRAVGRSDDEWVSYAKDICYRQLGMMERSVWQLRQALERNLVPPTISDQILEQFIASGLVDDARFAGMFVRSKFAEKTISRRGLRQELLRRGVAEEIISQALEQIDSESELQAALDFAMRKVQAMRSLEPQVVRRRLYGGLARRGFSPSQIRQAISCALEDGGVD